MAVASGEISTLAGGFVHEAFFYRGEAEYLVGLGEFIREGLSRGERVMVALPAEKVEKLRRHLGPGLDQVSFVDMKRAGSNPSRILGVWRDFVDACALEGVPCRGAGEPVWPGRTAPQLAECHVHELLLNVAFAEGPEWRLLCPYDADRLPPAEIEAAARVHPTLAGDKARRSSPLYPGLSGLRSPFSGRLPEPPASALEIGYDSGSLPRLRSEVARLAAGAGLKRRRVDQLLLAVSEVAGNSISHGGGRGRARLWTEPDSVLCECSDRGRITSPLVGRVRPELGQSGARGLWLVNQLCDLVQIRSGRGGTHVRLLMDARVSERRYPAELVPLVERLLNLRRQLGADLSRRLSGAARAALWVLSARGVETLLGWPEEAAISLPPDLAAELQAQGLLEPRGALWTLSGSGRVLRAELDRVQLEVADRCRQRLAPGQLQALIQLVDRWA